MIDSNIKSYVNLPSPISIKKLYPITCKIQDFVDNSKKEIVDILNGKSSKKIIIVGPCSIHSISEATEYAEKLSKHYTKNKIKNKINNTILIMRVYFEKPRTTVGWKGYLNDPNIDNTYDIVKGIKNIRKLLLTINDMNIACGCEWLNTITPQYFDDLISWGCIGARTVESQTHRQLVSGLSMPIGFKNTTDGNIQKAIDAMICCKQSHTFIGMNPLGIPSLIQTNGNTNTHIILRGSSTDINYDYKTIQSTNEKLVKLGLSRNIIVDCSHGNSNYHYKNQSKVVDYLLNCGIMKHITGIMLESNINEGNQKHPIKKGVSITDECINFDETIKLINRIEKYNK